ncbi:ATP-binding cassette domain-containing protein [Paenibacillus phyllosphaerae]|nr:ABC transporter ATP-binding protein [Paenibacillus phyllosphaerae]
MIRVEHVRKRFGRKQVLRDISMEARRGEITCLVGTNGSGKSTLLRAIMGLTPLSGGRVEVDGAAFHHGMYEKVAFIPDTLTMPPGMTVRACMTFMQDFYRSWEAARGEELLAFFKLDPASRVGSLSKGTAAKLNLVLGLGLNADYVLMDEPFSGIDLFSREHIASVFASELIEDRGVLFTTHEIQDVEHLIDKVVMLDQGVIAKEFYCEDIRQREGKSVLDVMREVYQA